METFFEMLVLLFSLQKCVNYAHLAPAGFKHILRLGSHTTFLNRNIFQVDL